MEVIVPGAALFVALATALYVLLRPRPENDRVITAVYPANLRAILNSLDTAIDETTKVREALSALEQ